MELIIYNDGTYSLVEVTKQMIDHIKILADVDCFSLCDIIRLEFTEYLDYVHVMTKKGYDPKIMLKHVFGLKKGEKDAKRFRVKVAEIMNSSSLVENKDELLSMV